MLINLNLTMMRATNIVKLMFLYNMQLTPHNIGGPYSPSARYRTASFSFSWMYDKDIDGECPVSRQPNDCTFHCMQQYATLKHGTPVVRVGSTNIEICQANEGNKSRFDLTILVGVFSVGNGAQDEHA